MRFHKLEYSWKYELLIRYSETSNKNTVVKKVRKGVWLMLLCFMLLTRLFLLRVIVYLWFIILILMSIMGENLCNLWCKNGSFVSDWWTDVFCLMKMCGRVCYLIKHSHTSERTISYIYMPLSNKSVRYCHTNIGDCSLNGAFIVLSNNALSCWFVD